MEKKELLPKLMLASSALLPSGKVNRPVPVLKAKSCPIDCVQSVHCSVLAHQRRQASKPGREGAISLINGHLIVCSSLVAHMLAVVADCSQTESELKKELFFLTTRCFLLLCSFEQK